MDMAFAALRFLNDRYSHVVEQRNDVVKEKDWANIIRREDRIEDGAIAIARAAEPDVEAATVYAELDRITDLVRARVAELEVAETASILQAVGETEDPAPDQVEEEQPNRFSLQEVTDLSIHADDVQLTAPEERPRVFATMPNGQPDNRHSLLEAAQRIADESQMGFLVGSTGASGAASVESDLHESALAHSYAAQAEVTAFVSATSAAAAAAASPPSSLPVELRALNAVLFEDLGFNGNRQDYYDPFNSMIHRVLEARTGNPITLSVVYLAIARRLGLALSGAECPSHFIVRGDAADGEPYFVDVFNGGKVMSLDSCKEMFLTARSALLDKKDLGPVLPVQIYSRMMRNLVNSHMILGNGDKALLWCVSLLLPAVSSEGPRSAAITMPIKRCDGAARSSRGRSNSCYVRFGRTERLRVLEQAHTSILAPVTSAAVEEEKPSRGWRGRIHRD